MADLEAKRELQQYSYNLLQMKNALNELKDLEKNAFSLKSQNYEQTFVDGGKRTSTVERAYEQIEKSAIKTRLLLEKCQNENDIIMQSIKSVGGVLGEILLKRYIFKQPFEKIASDLHYDYFWTLKLHKKALTQYSIMRKLL